MNQKNLTRDTIPDLINEARMLSGRGARQDALLIYNHAYNLSRRPQADPAVYFQQIICDDVEKLLSGADAVEIEKILAIKDLAIPRDILTYWSGYHLARKKAHGPATRTLNGFLDAYPGHPRGAQVRQLLTDLGPPPVPFEKKRLGVILPMSGKYKLYGHKAMKGIRLCLERLAEQGITDLNIVVRDSMGDASHAAMCVEQLGKEKVFAILGPVFVSRTVADKAQALDIPLMALTQKTEFPRYGAYIFSNFITPEMQAQALGSYMFHNLGFNSAAVLYPDDRYGNRYMQAFRDVVNGLGGHMAGVQPYKVGKTDFSAPITGLIRNTGMNFQALFIPDSVSRINLILPQLAYHDLQGITLLGTNLWHRKELLKENRQYNSNTVICDGYFADSTNPETVWFDKAFQDMYQQAPGFLEAIAYDTARILFTAADADNITSGAELRDALQGGFVFDGATGPTRFDETGAPHKELFMMTVSGDRFVPLYP